MPYSSNDELPAAVRSKYTAKQQRAFRAAYNQAAKQGLSEARRFQNAHAAARRAGDSDQARDFSTERREQLAKKGHALPDGSFPIVNKQDLRNAISAYGRASNKARAKAHIIKRARALGATDLLPEGWASDSAARTRTTSGAAMPTIQEQDQGFRQLPGSTLRECVYEDCARTFISDKAASDHALAVHSHGEIREAVGQALREHFFGPPRRFVYVVETADDWVVYEVESDRPGIEKMYRRSFSFDGGKVTFSDDETQVRRRIVYEPVSSDDTAKKGSNSNYPKDGEDFACSKCSETFETERSLKDHRKKKGH